MCGCACTDEAYLHIMSIFEAMVPKSKVAAGSSNKSQRAFPAAGHCLHGYRPLAFVLVGSCTSQAFLHVPHRTEAQRSAQRARILAHTQCAQNALSRQPFVDVCACACNAEITVLIWRCFGLSNWIAMQRARTEGATSGILRVKERTTHLGVYTTREVLMRVKKFTFCSTNAKFTDDSKNTPLPKYKLNSNFCIINAILWFKIKITHRNQ